MRACSSAAERSAHNRLVPGSIPGKPTPTSHHPPEARKLRIPAITPTRLLTHTDRGGVPQFLRLATLVVLSVFIMGQTPGERTNVFDKPLQLHRGPAGPYEVIITIQPHKPKVGTVHFGVTVLDHESQTAVEDALVRIVAYPPNPDDRALQTPALNDPATPIHYKGNIIFRSPGQWSLLTEIKTAERGLVTATTPIYVAEASSVPSVEGLFMLALVTLALCGGTAYIVFSIRRAQRSREASP